MVERGDVGDSESKRTVPAVTLPKSRCGGDGERPRPEAAAGLGASAHNLPGQGQTPEAGIVPDDAGMVMTGEGRNRLRQGPARRDRQARVPVRAEGRREAT